MLEKEVSVGALSINDPNFLSKYRRCSLDELKIGLGELKVSCLHQGAQLKVVDNPGVVEVYLKRKILNKTQTFRALYKEVNGLYVEDSRSTFYDN
jgi:hypothetical protein